jgi:transcriptional regulator with XRE-family HTH domain
MKYNKLKVIELIQGDPKKLTQISKKTGISYSMIGRFSRGESVPSIDSLPLIAAYFGKDMNYFFDEVPTENDCTTVSESHPKYGGNPWQLLFEKQLEITELTAEIERLKNAYAKKNGAQVG